MTVDTQAPSPFAASLLFGYVANYLYDGDAPLAERRAQALSVDQAQLRELLGEAELRELLDRAALARARASAAGLGRGPRSARAPTASTTCCCASATSALAELAARVEAAAGQPPAAAAGAWLDALVRPSAA